MTNTVDPSLVHIYAVLLDVKASLAMMRTRLGTEATDPLPSKMNILVARHYAQSAAEWVRHIDLMLDAHLLYSSA